MKLDELPEMPTDTRELIGATEHAIRQRLAYAKELLEYLLADDQVIKHIIEARQLIDKLNSEGL